MAELADLRHTIKLITFDCYGTLIDWEQGIRAALGRLSGRNGAGLTDLVQAYIRYEASIEEQAYQSYKNVQSATLRQVAATYRFSLPDGQADALSDALPDWLPFPDTSRALRRLKSRYDLGILSNIDRDLLTATRRHFPVDFDVVITAEDVRGYKPGHLHFIRMLNLLPDRGAVLHVAQSLYHDAAPAAQLGLNYVWINRYGQPRPAGVPMLAEFATLDALADALGVPAAQSENVRK